MVTVLTEPLAGRWQAARLAGAGSGRTTVTDCPVFFDDRAVRWSWCSDDAVDRGHPCLRYGRDHAGPVLPVTTFIDPQEDTRAHAPGPLDRGVASDALLRLPSCFPILGDRFLNSASENIRQVRSGNSRMPLALDVPQLIAIEQALELS